MANPTSGTQNPFWETPVNIKFPMVSTVDELTTALSVLEEAAGGARPEGLKVGIMVEVPAAALKAMAFVHHVDFFSLGTNDLTQYTLAPERGNDAVARLADPLDPGGGAAGSLRPSSATRPP
jgi:phosphocarrier protein FPr